MACTFHFYLILHHITIFLFTRDRERKGNDEKIIVIAATIERAFIAIDLRYDFK